LLLRSPAGKAVLIAGELSVPVDGDGKNYTITNNGSDPLLTFGTAGSFRPSPNGNQDESYWTDSSGTYGTALTEFFNDSPNGEWTLGLIANTTGGAAIVSIDSWSLEVLTSTNETRTVWSVHRDDGGTSALAAYPYEPDTAIQQVTYFDNYTVNYNIIGANEVVYFRFRSPYAANYYLNAGGYNTGGIRLDIYRNWNASGSPATTYTNLFDSQQKRLSCTAGEFITFKFTNTVDSSKPLRLRLQSPGVHYELSADEQNWFMPNRWKWGGSSATAAATYNLNLKRLTNRKFALRLLEGIVTTSNSGEANPGVGQVVSESNTFYYYDSTRSQTQELVFAMGGSNPATRHMETLTGVLHTENDANDPERQAIKYDSACRGGTPPEDTTAPPTTTGQPWVAGYYCVSDSYQGTTSCSYISSRPATNPLVTYSGPYASAGACDAACVATTTTTAAPFVPGWYCFQTYGGGNNASGSNGCSYFGQPPEVPSNNFNDTNIYYQLLSGPYNTQSVCLNAGCPPTTTTAAPTTTTTTTAAPTTTTTTTTTTAAPTTSNPVAGIYCVQNTTANQNGEYLSNCMYWDFTSPTGSAIAGPFIDAVDCENSGCGSTTTTTSTTTSTTTTTTTTTTTPAPTTSNPTQSPTTTGAGTTGDPTITTQPGTTSAPSYRYNCQVVAMSGTSFFYDCVSTGSTTNGTFASLVDCQNSGCPRTEPRNLG
jgi:hypothetical protein